MQIFIFSIFLRHPVTTSVTKPPNHIEIENDLFISVWDINRSLVKQMMRLVLFLLTVVKEELKVKPLLILMQLNLLTLTKIFSCPHFPSGWCKISMIGHLGLNIDKVTISIPNTWFVWKLDSTGVQILKWSSHSTWRTIWILDIWTINRLFQSGFQTAFEYQTSLVFRWLLYLQ